MKPYSLAKKYVLTGRPDDRDQTGIRDQTDPQLSELTRTLNDAQKLDL